MELLQRPSSLMQPLPSYGNDEFDELLTKLFSDDTDLLMIPEDHKPEVYGNRSASLFDEAVLTGIEREKWASTAAASAVTSIQKYFSPTSSGEGSGGSLPSFKSEQSGTHEPVSSMVPSTADQAMEEASAPLSKIERSRRAQHKFREKQRSTLASLNQQLDNVTRQLQQLNADNDSLRQKTKVLDAFLKLRDEQLFMLQTMHNPDENIDKAVDAALALAPCKKSREEISNELRQIQVISPEAFITRWRTFLRNVSSWLVRAEASSTDTEAQQKISALCGCAGWVCKNVSLLNWSTMSTIFTYNLEDSNVDDPGDAHWDRIAQLLVLTPDQCRDITSAREFFFSEQQKILQEREKLFVYAQNTTVQHDALYKNGTNEFDKYSAHELQALLHANLQATHQLVTTFSEFVFSKVFTPLQFAKAAVYSYPYFPCGLGLAMAVARV